MTIDQFIDKLGRLRHKSTGKRLKWHYERELYAPFNLSKRLRVGFVGASRQCYCPITAVAKAESGIRFSSVDFITAGRWIGLSTEDSWQIVYAADLGDRPLRSRLLKACGLPAEDFHA